MTDRETKREADTERGYEGGKTSGGLREGEETENVRTLSCAAKRLIPLDVDIYGRFQNASCLNLGLEEACNHKTTSS